MVYFTSDLHFFHENVISFAKRPFENAQEMNAALIRLWNERVCQDDDVYILGDVTMKGAGMAQQVISQLHGRKYLIRGNHDRFAQQASFPKDLFVWVKDYAVVKAENAKFVLFHYPIAEWDGFYRAAIHLHGHQHNSRQYNEKNREAGLLRYDVGVDANNMAPVSAQEILRFFQPLTAPEE